MTQPSAMADQPAPAIAAARAGRVGPRTLTTTRWLAITGQATTLLVVHYGFGFTLPIEPAMVVVAVSALLNLTIALRPPGPAGLSERQAVGFLAFDILQLAALLFLTGGMTNPFALLIVAPVTVSATILTRRSTIALCGLAIASASFLAVWHMPFPVAEVAGLPPVFRFGTWVAVVVGTIFLAAYAGIVAAERRRMHRGLAAAQAALAGEQRLSSLGALAAAAAHELGSPLSTIAVTVKELARDATPDDPWAEDIGILQTEVERCRAILAELGRAPQGATGDAGSPFVRQPLSAFVRAAANAQPHDGLTLDFVVDADDGSPEPTVLRRPEYIHGLASLIQNACQFARRGVVIRSAWTKQLVKITIQDDGPGFPPALLDRLGEPYVSSRAHTGEHMGLGIFIARNLLQQTGAKMSCTNAVSGARVEISWPRPAIDVEIVQPAQG